MDVTLEPATELGGGARLGCRTPGWCPCPPAVVVHRGGRAVPHWHGYREVLRPDLPDLADDVGWMLAGEPAPIGPARRGAKPPVFPVTAIDDPAPPEVLAELTAVRADAMDADTSNRELPIVRKAIGW